jgi:cell division protein FtsW
MSSLALSLGRGATGRPAGDPVLFGCVAALLVVGLAMVYSASAAISLDRFGTPHHYFVRHVWHLGIASAALVAAWLVDYRKLDRSFVVHGLWALLVVLLVLTFFQPEVGGARRWLRFAGFSVQPSEFAKIGVILVGAFQLARRHDRLDDPWRGVLPPLVLVSWLALLTALQPDFGTAAMLLGLLGLLAFVAGTPWKLMIRCGGAAGALLALYLVQEPYRLLRLKAYLDPAFDPQGANFQLRQALIALGTGGLFGRSSEGLLGTGLGCSLQKLFFLPEAHTDFVYAVLGEELGLAGTLVVLGLFALLLYRGFRVAANAATAFGTLVATGCTAMLGVQALVNMMVVVGLVPTKGIPLPFLSAGGSSLVVSALGAGLLLSVSRHG